MIKTAIVSHTYPTTKYPGQASFIKQEAHLTNTLANVELHIPAVYAFPFQKQYIRTLQIDEAGIPVHRFYYLSFPNRQLASVTKKSISNRLLKSLDNQNPDLVHIHWLFPSGLTVPALKKNGYPVVLTIHGGDWYSNVSNRKLMSLLTPSLQLCDKIISVGKQLTRDISDFHMDLKEKLIHIPHGIDTGLFHFVKNKRRVVENLGWNTNKTNLLCVANLYREKGVDLLIKAFFAISERDKYHLHIVSPTSNTKIKSEVDQFISMHKLNKQVTFYNSMKQEQLVDFFRAANLLISPSRKEGFGLVVAESIACGTPVLATRSGGPEEIVNTDCGILVDANSTASLSDGLKSILKKLNSYQADKMHYHIRTNFSIDAKKEKLKAVYRDITF